jgi:polar amino acid transport system ATP-binding protein
MDEGGIYEDGTPDEIFDSPKREKIRLFIRKSIMWDKTACVLI